MLKNAHGVSYPSPELPKDAVGSHPLLEPLGIIGTRVASVDGRPIKEILVQWMGLPLEETSWKDFEGFLL